MYFISLHIDFLWWPFLEDGYDETLVPLDYQSAGQIRDDDLFNTLVGPMRKGVTLTVRTRCEKFVFFILSLITSIRQYKNYASLHHLLCFELKSMLVTVHHGLLPFGKSSCGDRINLSI